MIGIVHAPVLEPYLNLFVPWGVVWSKDFGKLCMTCGSVGIVLKSAYVMLETVCKQGMM